MITKKSRTLSIEVPAAVHLATRYRVESGESVVWITKRVENDWNNHIWDFHNSSHPNLTQALGAAGRHVENLETERLMQIALNEKRYG